jgi:hypothetical protein
VTASLAGSGVMLAALYLLAFGAASLVAPQRASRYLLGFAGSVRVHVLELVARLAVGMAFLGHAPRMPLAGAFHVLGLVLVATTVGLAALPWHWHRRFARRAVPAVLPHLAPVGAVSIAGGAFVLWAAMSAWFG